MRKRFRWGLLALLTWPALAFKPSVSPTPEPISPLVKPASVPKRLKGYDEKPIMLLMEADRQREIYAERVQAAPVSLSTLLPSRIYLYYEPGEGRWYQVITDAYGKLKTHPMEYIRAGTIVPGACLGAKNPIQNYYLGKDRLWIPTFKKERYEFWVASRPALAKYVEFMPMLRSAPAPAPAAKGGR